MRTPQARHLARRARNPTRSPQRTRNRPPPGRPPTAPTRPSTPGRDDNDPPRRSASTTPTISIWVPPPASVLARRMPPVKRPKPRRAASQLTALGEHVSQDRCRRPASHALRALALAQAIDDYRGLVAMMCRRFASRRSPVRSRLAPWMDGEQCCSGAVSQFLAESGENPASSSDCPGRPAVPNPSP